MADETSKPRPAQPEYLPRHKRLARGVLLIGGIAVVVALLAFGGWRAFGNYQVRRQIAVARGMMQSADYPNAGIALRRVLSRNPGHLDATRMMAELAETVGSKAAVGWRHKLVGLEPGVIENHLAFARAALRFGDREAAEVAVGGVPEAGRQTLEYHDLAMKVSAMSRQSAETLAHLEEAARLDPQNEMYQFNLALLDLRSIIPATRKLARSKMEELARSPKTEGVATRALIEDALKRGDAAEALILGERISRAPKATFTDRLVQLNVLGRLKRKEFWWCLAQLEQLAEGESARTRTKNSPAAGVEPTLDLLLWLNRAGLASEAIEWTNRMPAEMQVLEPIRMVLTETHQILGDWTMVGVLTQAGNWGTLDWKRKALYARSLRGEGERSGWSEHWSGAVSASRERPEALAELARIAIAWKWDDQAVEVLWLMVADGKFRDIALGELNKRYFAAGKTREMLRVARAELDAAPANTGRKNNVAYLSMLLEEKVKEAFAMAAEVYKLAPETPQFAATHAYALHLQRDSKEALKVLRLLSAEQLAEPSVALAYGVILADIGSRKEAERYLELASHGTLLPEEKALIARRQ